MICRELTANSFVRRSGRLRGGGRMFNGGGGRIPEILMITVAWKQTIWLLHKNVVRLEHHKGFCLK